jgi:hypothetical protein
MDALKLFYAQQLDAQRRRDRDRLGRGVAPLRPAEAAHGPDPDGARASACANAPRAAEAEDAPQRDAGIADAQRAGETGQAAEVLLRHVEQHAGQALRTPASIDAYFAASSSSARDASPPKRYLIREAFLVLFLAVAVLQYYYVEVALEIASLNKVTVFVPVEQHFKPRPGKS